MASRTASQDRERAAASTLQEALRLQDRAYEAPREVVEAASKLLTRPRLGAEPRAVGHRAAAWALRVLDRPQDAVREARRSAAVARRSGLAGREAEARLTLSLCLFQAGHARAALAQIEQASDIADRHEPGGATAVLVSAQHGILLERLGRIEEALDRYRGALAGSLSDVDRARVLNNRAIALAFSGRLDEAVEDLEAGILLARAAGSRMLEAELIHNLGFALTLVGDLPAALGRFDDADALFGDLGAPIGLNLVARARALLRANLHREAREAARAAVAELMAGGAAADVAEAQVLLAVAELADGDAHEAAATAALARRALQRQARPALAALAEAVIVRARTALGRHDRRTFELAARCADALGEAGLVAEELDARLTAGLVARSLGDAVGAARHLDAVRRHRERGPLVERSRAWHAEAVRRLDADDGEGARRAVEAGLDAVGDLQALMGSTELRVGVAGHGAALADLGLRLAVREGDAWAVLRLLDRWRGASLELGQAREADDSVAVDLGALRAATARLQQETSEGEDPSASRRTVAELEARIRARARRAAGAGRGRRSLLDRAQLHRDLASARLLVYFELDGRLGVVAVADGQAELAAEAGPSRREVDELIGAALFALRRLARPSGPPAGRAAALISFEEAIRRLDDALVLPFVDGHDDALVVCPTGPLHALPWSALPSCVARPVSVAPALAAVGPQAPVDVTSVVLAAGPGLDGVLAELEALRTVYPGARTFTADHSRVEEVLAALEGAGVAHLACHGRFRIDNPMFSSLELADGALTVFDLEKLEQAPALVVLAACDVGSAAVSAGDELLGLAAALHRAGTGTVVASLVPVPDDLVVHLMLELHRGVAAGRPVAAALAAARTAVAVDTPASVAVRAAFTCFGLG